MNNRKFMVGVILAATLVFASMFPLVGYATELMPAFDTVPIGWKVDRYAPTSFSNVGTYQGRNNVLGIEITSAGDLNNRPAGYQTTFYNTQGFQYAVTGGSGSTLSADLYIPASWLDATQGNVRTDMWAVMTDGAVVTDYPIIGFTNYGGEARFRVWDESLNAGAGDWVNLTTPVTTDAWTAFSINFTGSSYIYSINGTTVYTDTTIGDSTGFSALIMQAYNFNDPSISGATLADYTANWSNSQVPLPPSALLMGSGLLGLVGLGWRRRKTNA
jgi:hypothetical protein